MGHHLFNNVTTKHATTEQVTKLHATFRSCVEAVQVQVVKTVHLRFWVPLDVTVTQSLQQQLNSRHNENDKPACTQIKQVTASSRSMRLCEQRAETPQ